MNVIEKDMVVDGGSSRSNRLGQDLSKSKKMKNLAKSRKLKN